MGFQFQDLDRAAVITLAVVGLISVLAPLINLIVRSLKEFQFGRPGLCAALAEVASLGTFLAVLKYRNSLHLFPPFWMLLVGFVTAVIVLVILDAMQHSSQPKSLRKIGLSIAGLGVYVLAASLLTASFTKFSAEELIFRRVYGSVRDCQDKPLVQFSVFWTSGSPTPGSATLETVTNCAGWYEFLLTETEARVATELYVGQNSQTDDNFIYVNFDDNSFPFRADFKCVR